MVKVRISSALLKTFFEKHPADAARALELLPQDEARAVLLELPLDLACAAIEYMDPHVIASIFDDLTPEQVKPFFEKGSPERVADILLNYSAEKRDLVLGILDQSQAQILKALLSYPPETAGGMMSPGATALNKNLTVGEAVRIMRTFSKRKPLYYVYVTDDENHLVGVLGMRDLILADPRTPIESIMIREVFSIPASMDREEIVKMASKHRFVAIPVVDESKKLLGIIQSKDLIEAAEEEASEDIQKMFGAGGDEEAFSPVLFSVKKDCPGF